jgi:hypothetical protein
LRDSFRKNVGKGIKELIADCIMKKIMQRCSQICKFRQSIGEKTNSKKPLLKAKGMEMTTLKLQSSEWTIVKAAADANSGYRNDRKYGLRR